MAFQAESLVNQKANDSPPCVRMFARRKLVAKVWNVLFLDICSTLHPRKTPKRILLEIWAPVVRGLCKNHIRRHHEHSPVSPR
jgi:hypothetical protein